MSGLDELRLEINEITDEMVKLFERRLEVSKKIGDYKKANNLPIYQKEREEAILNHYKEMVSYPEQTLSFIEDLMKYSKEVQK